jgi:hypothetical protein
MSPGIEHLCKQAVQSLTTALGRMPFQVAKSPVFSYEQLEPL